LHALDKPQSMADTGGRYETARTGLNDPCGETAERASVGFTLGRALDARGDCAAACAARRAANRPKGPQGPGHGAHREQRRKDVSGQNRDSANDCRCLRTSRYFDAEAREFS